MQTAVEFLQEKIKIYLPSIHQKGLEYAFKQAKEMEKKQIIDACKNFGNLNGVDIEDYEQYYNETYGSKGSDDKTEFEKPFMDFAKHFAKQSGMSEKPTTKTEIDFLKDRVYKLEEQLLKALQLINQSVKQ